MRNVDVDVGVDVDVEVDVDVDVVVDALPSRRSRSTQAGLRWCSPLGRREGGRGVQAGLSRLGQFRKMKGSEL